MHELFDRGLDLRNMGLRVYALTTDRISQDDDRVVEQDVNKTDLANNNAEMLVAPLLSLLDRALGVVDSLLDI